MTSGGVFSEVAAQRSLVQSEFFAFVYSFITICLLQANMLSAKSPSSSHGARRMSSSRRHEWICCAQSADLREFGEMEGL